ncbi:Proton myo-inositol cotransporter [Myotis brandtii]|uniref:Proton myo-inositol cotransporter n=1 Tax=Myotis brandtii TaxID=109478 RepID=S7Q8T4_MYOBR|nr:Proton myo-inositol cotransporter [Myotis brandtii]
MTVPVYIAEVSPPNLRGRLVTINTLFITGGQFFASVVDGAFSYLQKDGWRYMLGLAAIPAVIQFFGFLFLPESPRWLIQKGQTQKARRILSQMRGNQTIDEEYDSIKNNIEEEEKEVGSAGPVICRMLSYPPTRRALIVGCGLQMFQQLSGINTVMYYSATILQMSGVEDDRLAIWLASVTAFTNFIFTLVGVWLVEKVGRRKLTFGSLAGTTVALIILALGFLLSAQVSPRITFKPIAPSGQNATCTRYSYCNECMLDPDCGFCYKMNKSTIIDSSCVPVNKASTSEAAWGRNKENSAPVEDNSTGKSEAKKRKIAETSNVITESLPSVESEPVEIEVEIAEGTMEVEDKGLETLEDVASAKQSIKYIQNTGSSDSSVLPLSADITSKYRQGDRKGQLNEEGCASDPTSKQEHMKSHSTESFKCEIRNKRYLRQSAWKQHLGCYHLTGVGAKKGRKKLYECQVCNSVFNSWDQFKDHLVIHTGDKPNHCTLCDLWFMQGNELRRHLSDTHNITERLVTEEVLSVETRVQTEPVTSMTIIDQVGKVHVLPLLQVQVDSAQVTVEQVHPDLLQDGQVHDSHMSELPEQVQVSYLEVGRIQTEEGTEVHVEELHVEQLNQVPPEVHTELLQADLGP